jgi:hypothetical protein
MYLNVLLLVSQDWIAIWAGKPTRSSPEAMIGVIAV